MSEAWNLATLWEAVADELPGADALCHGELTRSWAEFDDRAARLAAVLAAEDVGRRSSGDPARPGGTKVGLLLYNGPEYIESTFACFKLGAVAVNVNYRYTGDELVSLLADADVEVVIASADLARRLDDVRDRLPLLRRIVTVGAPGGDHLDYEASLAAARPLSRSASESAGRSGDDLWFLYTGGTTGHPKGVMWPHRSLYGTTASTFKGCGEQLADGPLELAAAVRRIHASGREVRLLPAAPLMHGTSAISSWAALCVGGTIVTLRARRLDVAELLGAVGSRRVTDLTIVGDAFARPLIEELDSARAAERPYDTASLRLIVSSGAMWSQPVKDALLARLDVTLADLVGSSEGVGMARSVSRRGRSAQTARFRLGPRARVVGEDGATVAPGSGQIGMLAVGGPIPVGYYRDSARSEATFRVIDGVVWSIPGDAAAVEADGTITLLGRGSACINTAGEKVFPEEVEETLKTCAGVRDAQVVGVPHDRWGEAVTALVSLEAGVAATAAELIAHCRSSLAGYKCPKEIFILDEVVRGPNGKADHRWAKATAEQLVGRARLVET